MAPDEVIVNKNIDALCIGQGEEAWQEFLSKFKNKQDITDIKNFWVKLIHY